MIGSTLKYKVTLLGQSYTFVSDEAEDTVHAALHLVEATLNEIVTQTSCADKQKVALLTAVNLALKQVHLEHGVALQADQQAKLMSLLTHVDIDL